MLNPGEGHPGTWTRVWGRGTMEPWQNPDERLLSAALPLFPGLMRALAKLVTPSDPRASPAWRSLELGLRAESMHT